MSQYYPIRPHRPDAISQCDVIFQFSKANKTRDGKKLARDVHQIA